MKERALRIVCLGWGSLIWKPGLVPVASEWNRGGPDLPIEFARVGEEGELATVISPGHPLHPVRWAALEAVDLATARHLLRKREGIDRLEEVGTIVKGQPAGAQPHALDILQWATWQEGIDAVIWTASPPRFDDVTGRVPSPEAAASYLRCLTGKKRRHAEDYVLRVPDEIQTNNRRALEETIVS